MKLASLIRVGVSPILGVWLGCNTIIGLELGEPNETDIGVGSGGGEGGAGGAPMDCGNGKVDEGEECDDANDNADDGCNACQVDCVFPVDDALEGESFVDPTTHPPTLLDRALQTEGRAFEPRAPLRKHDEGQLRS